MRPILIILCSVIGLASGVGVLPDSVSAAVGDTVRFSTSLSPGQTPFISVWAFQEEQIIARSASSDAVDERYRHRITLSTQSGSLELRDLALSDAGVYTVAIVPAGGAVVETGAVTLNVHERVTNVKVTASDTDLVEFNDTVSLSCSATGTNPTFLWFNGSAELKASERVSITNGGANVTIDPVLRYDQGSYTCRVSDAASTVTSNPLPLSVSYGPDFVRLEGIPSGEHHETGSSIYMDCLTDSRPPAHITWFSDEQMLPSNAVTFLLLYVTPANNGNYRCEVYNNKTHRELQSEPAPITVWDRIHTGFILASTVQLEGASVNLTCNASGTIQTVEWKRDDVELKPSENIVFYDEKQVLSFRNLTRKDDGKYTCDIINPINSESVDYNMRAIYGPENVKITGEVEVVEGGTLKLSCSAESTPESLYIWTKNGTYLAQSPDYVKESIRESDSGLYICKVTNEITLHKDHESVTVVVVPKSGLSAGAIAGITIATIVVVGGVAGGAFYFFKNR